MPKSDRIGVAFEIVTTVGTPTTYRWSFGPAVDIGVSPAQQYDDRIIDPGSLKQDVAAPDNPLATIDAISLTVAQFEGDLLLARKRDGVRLDAARVRVFLVEHGRFSSTALDGDGFVADLDFVGRVTIGSGRFTKETLQLSVEDPTADAMSYSAPPFDLPTEDESIPEQQRGALFPMYWGHCADYGRFKEALCLDMSGPWFTATDVRNYKGEVVFGFDVSPKGDSPWGDYNAGAAWAMRSDKVDATNPAHDAKPSNPAKRVVLAAHWLTISQATGRFKLKAAVEAAEDGITARVTGPWFNSQEADDSVDPPIPSGEQPVYTEDITLPSPPNPPDTVQTIDVKNQDFLIADQAQQMCWIFYFPGDRLMGPYTGQINLTIPLPGASFKVDPVHVGDAAYILLRHLAPLTDDDFHLPDFFREGEGGSTGGELDPLLADVFTLGILNERRSIGEWLQALLWETGASLVRYKGKLRLMRFDLANPTVAPSMVLGPDEIEVDSLSVSDEGWGDYFNVLTVQDAGHPVYPGQFPAITHTAKDGWGEHLLRGEKPYANGTYVARWLNIRRNSSSGTPAKFKAAVQRMVDNAAADKLVIPFTLLLPIDAMPGQPNARDGMNLTAGKTFDLWWDPRDPWAGLRDDARFIPQSAPERFTIIGIVKHYASWTVELRCIAAIEAPIEEGDGAVTLPTYLAAEAGYGAGETTAWNPAWSDRVVRWVKRHLDFWLDDDGYADPGDPRSRYTGIA